jgi:hypothetical protein
MASFPRDHPILPKELADVEEQGEAEVRAELLRLILEREQLQEEATRLGQGNLPINYLSGSTQPGNEENQVKSPPS